LEVPGVMWGEVNGEYMPIFINFVFEHQCPQLTSQPLYCRRVAQSHCQSFLPLWSVRGVR
jgi:hypothetical protein